MGNYTEVAEATEREGSRLERIITEQRENNVWLEQLVARLNSMCDTLGGPVAEKNGNVPSQLQSAEVGTVDALARATAKRHDLQTQLEMAISRLQETGIV